MSLFNKVGRKFERTKQAFMQEANAAYVCQACEQTVDDDYEYCPHCGEASVEPIE